MATCPKFIPQKSPEFAEPFAIGDATSSMPMAVLPEASFAPTLDRGLSRVNPMFIQQHTIATQRAFHPVSRGYHFPCLVFKCSVAGNPPSGVLVFSRGVNLQNMGRV